MGLHVKGVGAKVRATRALHPKVPVVDLLHKMRAFRIAGHFAANRDAAMAAILTVMGVDGRNLAISDDIKNIPPPRINHAGCLGGKKPGLSDTKGISFRIRDASLTALQRSARGGLHRRALTITGGVTLWIVANF